MQEDACGSVNTATAKNRKCSHGFYGLVMGARLWAKPAFQERDFMTETLIVSVRGSFLVSEGLIVAEPLANTTRMVKGTERICNIIYIIYMVRRIDPSKNKLSYCQLSELEV